MPLDVTWHPPKRKLNSGKRKTRFGLIFLLGLVLVNVAVVLYHGDPLENIEEKPKPQHQPKPQQELSTPQAGINAPKSLKIANSIRTLGHLVEEFPQYNPVIGLRSPGPVVRVQEIILRRHQTAAGALINAGIDSNEVNRALGSLKSMIDFRQLRPGDSFKARFDNQDKLISLDVRRGLLNHARSEQENGIWQAKRLKVQVDTVLAEVKGEVKSSLWEALVDKNDEDPRLVHEIVNIFAWELDFYSEVYPGDTFRLLVEKRYIDGKFLDYGIISVAEFVSNGQAHRAFLHRGIKGEISYYNAHGKSMRKQLLKSPLKYGLITSSFGRRNHPILGYTRAHNGIDYGVPTGTPVWSVGDGRVMRAGRNGGYGKYIAIRHTNGWLSEYAHLSKVLIKVGQRVSQKEIIGKVGNTGMSTGPHLHYGLKRYGKHVNPATQKFQRGKALSGKQLTKFLVKMKELTRALQGIHIAQGAALKQEGT